MDGTANPEPLRLMGFGMTTVPPNIDNAGFFPIRAMILAMGFFYGGVAQITAGIFSSPGKVTPLRSPPSSPTPCTG